MNRSIRILLADDHQLFREGLRALLQTEPGMEVVGEAANGRMAVGLAERLNPDIVVMDIDMRGLNGFEATRRVVALKKTRGSSRFPPTGAAVRSTRCWGRGRGDTSTRSPRSGN